MMVETELGPVNGSWTRWRTGQTLGGWRWMTLRDKRLKTENGMVLETVSSVDCTRFDDLSFSGSLRVYEYPVQVLGRCGCRLLFDS